MDKKFWIGDGDGAEKAGFGPVSDYASARESGSEEFFYTNFNRGFGEIFCLGGNVITPPPFPQPYQSPRASGADELGEGE